MAQSGRTRRASSAKRGRERVAEIEALEQAIQSSINGIALSDLSGALTFVNQAFLRMWGYEKAGEVLGRPASSFWDSEAAAERVNRALREDGVWVGELTAKRRDGERFVVQLSAGLVRDAADRPRGMMCSFVDITDRREAEEALGRSEARYRALFETMAQGVVYQGSDGRILSANPAAERILGLSLEQMQGRTSLDPRWRAVREDGSDFPGERHPAMESLRTGKPVNGVTMGVYHPAEDEYHWILVDAVPEFRPGEARPHRVYTTFTDITERRRAEAALQGAKEYAERLIDTANSIVVGLDVRGNVTVFNRAAEEITGYSRAEIEGRSWFEVIVPRDRYPAVWAQFEGLSGRGISRNLENPILTKSGEERYIAWQNNPLHEGGVVAGTISFGIDITERRRAEESLRRRTEGLAILLDVSRSLGATLDLAKVLQAATDGVTRLFGLDTAAVYLVEGEALVLGATTPPFPPDLPDTLRRGRLADHPHVGRALSSGVPLLLPDMREADLAPAERDVAERRRLRTVVFLPLVAGVKSVGVLIVGSVGIPRPVSEAEIDLCRTLANLSALAVENARLYRAGRQHASDLERQIVERRRAEQERLEMERRLLHAQKLESLGILAGGIAHDFNNLLMAMMGNLDLALRELPPSAPARANLEQSAQAARRATDLTRQMLAYSGRGRFVVEPVDLSALVRENAHLLRSSVARTATLDLRLDDGLPMIEADAGQVQQVVMNLITNASEAIGEGPGRIVVTTAVQEYDASSLRHSRIDVVPAAGRFVFLEVSDTGRGMSEETQRRLFDPFFSTKAPGRGLGMSAILGIVRGHGGAILVDSAEGRGTAMRILFSALGRARPSVDGPDRGGGGAAQALPACGTVLVVDDEEAVRDVCRQMVEALGLPVLTAMDGRDAIEVFARNADAVSHVVLDLSMPNMDGMAAFEEIVRLRPGVKVLLSSGYDQRETIERRPGPGPAGFIQKPYSLATLREALEKSGGPRSDPPTGGPSGPPPPTT